jgi:hypothetical protein
MVLKAKISEDLIGQADTLVAVQTSETTSTRRTRRGGDRLSLLGAKEEGATHLRVAPRNLLMDIAILASPNSCWCC